MSSDQKAPVHPSVAIELGPCEGIDNIGYTLDDDGKHELTLIVNEYSMLLTIECKCGEKNCESFIANKNLIKYVIVGTAHDMDINYANSLYKDQSTTKMWFKLESPELSDDSDDNSDDFYKIS